MEEVSAKLHLLVPLLKIVEVLVEAWFGHQTFEPFAVQTPVQVALRQFPLYS